MAQHPFIRAWLAAAVLGAGGCVTPGPLEPTPLGQDELDAFLASGRDARNYGITTYEDAAGARFEFANRIHLGRTARLDFASAAGSSQPVVRAETPLTDKFPVLLDSSARQCWATMESMKGLVYRPFAPPTGEYPDHVSAAIPGYAGVGNKLVFEGIHVENPVFYVPPARGGLGPLARAGENLAAAPQAAKAADLVARRMPIVAGAAWMRSFAFLRFDFPARAVTLSTSGAFRPAAASAVRANLPLRDWKGRPAVEAVLDGQPILLVIDTAGDFALSLPGEATPDVPANLTLGGIAFDGVQPVSHAAIGLPEAFPARLGLGLLARYAVTLDYKNQRVWLEDPAGVAPESSAPSAPADPPDPIHYRGVRP